MHNVLRVKNGQTKVILQLHERWTESVQFGT